MRISFSLLLAVVLSFDALAAPVPRSDVGGDSALEVRKAAKAAPKKAPVKATPKAPVKAKAPIPKKAPTPVAKPKPAPAKAPVKAKPVVKPAPKAPAKAPVKTKPAVKAPVAKVPAKAKAPAKTAPKSKPVVKTAPVAKVPAKAKVPPKSPSKAKPVVKPAPVAKVPAKAPPKPKPVVKPVTVAKVPAAPKGTKPAPASAPKKAAAPPAKPAAPPAKAASPAVKSAAKAKASSAKPAPTPASCPIKKKPGAAAAAAPAKALTSRGKALTSACGVAIRASNYAKGCTPKAKFLFTNNKLDKKSLITRALSGRDSDSDGDDEDDDSDDSDSDDSDSDVSSDSDSESDDSDDGDFDPSHPDGPPRKKQKLTTPAGTNKPQCDHVVELRLLKRVIEAPGGICDTLKGIIASPNSGLTTADIATFMKPIKDKVNSANNVFSLDKTLNLVKRDEVLASLNGKAPVKSTDATLKARRAAVDGYLSNTSVNAPSVKLASDLDTLATKMVKDAETKALANIQSCAGTTATADANALKAAVAKQKTTLTVTSAWKAVLAHANAQGKI